MIHRSTYSLVGFLLWFCVAVGQDVSQVGVLLDAETQAPIAYARIYPASHPQLGTVSNEDGHFVVLKIGTADSLVIQHLGYGQQVFPPARWQQEDTFRLPPQPLNLDEVPIFSESPKELWSRVIDHFEQNHQFDAVTYRADTRLMYYTSQSQELHYLLQTSARLHYEGQKSIPKVSSPQVSWRVLSDFGEEIADKWVGIGAIPLVHLSRVFEDALRKRALRQFEVEVVRSFSQSGRSVAEVRLVPRKQREEFEYEFLIDLDSYGIIRAHKQNRLDPMARWDEMGFAPIKGKWYATYLTLGFETDFKLKRPYVHEALSTLQVEFTPVPSDAIGWFLTSVELTSYPIPWDDPSWQSCPLVPWPDWVAKRLKAEGLAR